METLNATWDQVEEFVTQLSEKAQGFNGVYGVPRGGLVLAVMLSHRCGLPLLAAPCDGCIIVDDIADTGETLQRYSGKHFIATMFYHRQSSFVPDFWLYEKGDRWIVYPWENK